MLLSVCITTFNRPQFLREMLHSIEKTTKSTNKVEIILLDNGSDLQTQEVISKWKSNLRFIRLRNEQNIRGKRTLEQILSVATGDFVIFPGDDDFFIDPGIEFVVEKLQEVSTEISMFAFGCNVKFMDNKRSKFHFQPKNYINEIDFLKNIILENQFYLPSTVARRSSIKPSLLPNSTTVLDWMLWIQLGLSGRIEIDKNAIITYRVHKEREQTSFLNEAWELDRANTFIESIYKGAISDWLMKQTPDSLENFIKSLIDIFMNRKASLIDKIIVWQLAIRCASKSENSRNLSRKLMISAGIDPRFADVATISNLDELDYSLALKGLGIIFNESANLIELQREYEKRLIQLKSDSLSRENLDGLGKIEFKVLNIYRGFRSIFLRIPGVKAYLRKKL